MTKVKVNEEVKDFSCDHCFTKNWRQGKRLETMKGAFYFCDKCFQEFDTPDLLEIAEARKEIHNKDF